MMQIDPITGEKRLRTQFNVRNIYLLLYACHYISSELKQILKIQISFQMTNQENMRDRDDKWPFTIFLIVAM